MTRKRSTSSNKPNKTRRKPKPTKARISHGSRRRESSTIYVTQTSIEYDRGLSGRAGYLAIDDSHIEPPNGDTLLHLLAFLIYTTEGGELLRNHRPSGDDESAPDVVRARLKAALRARFRNLPGHQLDSVIDAHFAADEYVSALDANDHDRKLQHEAIYRRKVLEILGGLHDDAMGHDFSMRW